MDKPAKNPPDGTLQVRPKAVAHAVREAFSTAADPPLVGVKVRPVQDGYKAELQFAGRGQTPRNRKRWVENEFYERWQALESLLGVPLYLRRQWRG
ncbi:MAG TPA: hypothetical protein VEI97_16895 [bacterium]|nr:hypothetical protein [bacterium]